MRWVVERTWAWLDHARSLTRDYERLPETCGNGLCGDDSINAQTIDEESHPMERKDSLTTIYKHTLIIKSRERNPGVFASRITTVPSGRLTE